MLPSAIAPSTNLQIALELDASLSVQGTTKPSDFLSAIAPSTNLQIALELDASLSVQGTTKPSDFLPIYKALQFQPYRDQHDRSSQIASYLPIICDSNLYSQLNFNAKYMVYVIYIPNIPTCTLPRDSI